MAGIYIHIPFCKQACNYCNFHFATSLRYKDELIHTLCLELDQRQSYLQNNNISTIYFGGGTPSLLTAAEINTIIDKIISLYRLNVNAEITLEANPDDLKLTYLNELRSTPINRLSIGVQSFYDEDLLWMNRAHTAHEADYTIKASQDKGFVNLNIDLIYGMPTLSNERWINNIEKVVGLGTPHISAYALTVEPQTTLFKQIRNKLLKQPNEQQSTSQMITLIEKLQSYGFEHYEISNFARQGKYAVHNTNYWRGEHYLGIGPSAHSFDGKSRQWNVANNQQYIQALRSNTPFFEKESLTIQNQFNEYIMTSLRTMWGCDLKKVEFDFGGQYKEELQRKSQKYQSTDLVKLQKDSLILTLGGKLMADKIASELFTDIVV